MMEGGREVRWISLVQLPVDTDGKVAGSSLLFNAWQRKHDS